MSCSRCVSSGDASGEQCKGALCDNRPSPGNAKSTRAHGRAVPAHRIAGMMATTIARLAPFRGIDFAQTFIAVGTLNTRLILTSGKLDDAGFAKLGEIGLPVREASCRLLHRGALGSPMAPLRRADNSGEVAKWGCSVLVSPLRVFGHKLLTRIAFGQKMLTCSVQQNCHRRMAVMPSGPDNI
jgi:hypothetical protein